MLEINCPGCLSSNILEDRQVARDIECINCGATFYVEKFTEEEEEATPESQPETIEAPPADHPLNNIVITTGPPPFEYDIIDTIFVLDTLDKKVFTNSSPSAVFEGAKIQLKKRAASLGGDAIINCQFDYRASAGHGIFGVVHDLEIFAYGTLVKKTS